MAETVSDAVVRARLGITPEGPAVDAYRQGLAELRALIQDGLDSGEPVDGDVVFARLRARYRTMADAHGD